MGDRIVRVFAIAVAFLWFGAAQAVTALQPIINACAPAPTPCTIVLADGEYDDSSPVYIRQDMGISGGRGAIIHSEMQIVDGAMVQISGVTLEMNKTGAPARSGIVNGVYPQNGFITIVNAMLWADDLEVHLTSGLSGYALLKNAFHVINGNLQLRAVTKFSRVDWRNSPYQVIELNYDSYANIFDVSGAAVGMNILSALTVTPTGTGAAITVTGSKLTMSGANVFNCLSGCAPNTGTTNMYGISVWRDGYVQIGAGLDTTVQYFTTPGGVNNGIFLDPTARKWVCATCTVD